MPIPAAILGAAVATGGSLLGTGASAYAQGKMNKKTRAWNEKMYARQRADSLSDYQMQNEYNHPSAIMQRLRDAKLNPNLIYGEAANMPAAQIRASDTPQWKPEAPTYDIGSAAAQGISTFQNMKMQEAQIDNLRVQNTVLAQEALLKTAQVLSTELGAEHSRFDLRMKNTLKDVSVQAAIENVRNLAQNTMTGEATEANLRASAKATLDENERKQAMQAPNFIQAVENILSTRAQRAKTEDERKQIKQQIINLGKDEQLKQLEIDLNKAGLQKGDPVYMRLLVRALGSDNVVQEIKDIIKEVKDWWNKPSPKMPSRRPGTSGALDVTNPNF